MAGSGSAERTSVETTSVENAWCDHCGGDAGEGPHDACVAARVLEPPRYCPRCRRRMKVQVLPAGWSAVCVTHGTTGPAR